MPNLRDLAHKRAPPVFVPGGVVASVTASAGRSPLWPRPVIPPKKKPGFKPPPPSVLAKAGVPIDVEELEDEASRWLRVGPPGPKEERVLPASLTQERVEVMVQPIDHFANPPSRGGGPRRVCQPTGKAKGSGGGRGCPVGEGRSHSCAAPASGPFRARPHGFIGGVHSHVSAFGGCCSAGLLEFRDEVPRPSD